MLEKEGKNIDACTIGIPDHMHATVGLACMQHGEARLCGETPDAHSVGSPAAAGRGGEIQGRDADGEPGVLA